MTDANADAEDAAGCINGRLEPDWIVEELGDGCELSELATGIIGGDFAGEDVGD